MPRRFRHDLENADHVLLGDIGVEQIAHRVDENSSRPAPGEWLFQALRPKRQVEALRVWVTWNTTPAFSKGLRVAMVTTWAHLGAPRHGVPGGGRPLNAATAHEPPGRQLPPPPDPASLHTTRSPTYPSILPARLLAKWQDAHALSAGDPADRRRSSDSPDDAQSLPYLASRGSPRGRRRGVSRTRRSRGLSRFLDGHEPPVDSMLSTPAHRADPPGTMIGQNPESKQ